MQFSGYKGRNRQNYLYIKVIALLALIFHCITLKSQNRSFLTLPIIQSENIKESSSENLNLTSDYNHILKIYNKLVNARGDFRYRIPDLYLKDMEGYVAFIDYNTNDIIFEKKAYDTCLKYGDSALAFLLAHELTHYYEKHAWKASFAKKNSDLKIGEKLFYFDDQLINETEADYLGAFLCFTAGFGIFDDGYNLISDLYQAYELPDSLYGYPSKNERKELLKRSAAMVKSLAVVFDFANYLSVTGDFEESYLCYRNILNYYQSRELYNNLGVTAVSSAMSYFSPTELQFKYVNELDVKYNGAKSVSMRNKLLEQAIAQFNAAINLDPDYAPAYLNKANAYALLNEYKKSTFYLNEEALPIALKNKDKFQKTVLDISILQGIIDAKEGRIDEARNAFQKAAELGSELGKENLTYLNNPELFQNAISIKNNPSYMKEKVNGMSLEKFYEELIVDEDNMVELNEDFTIFQDNSHPDLYQILLLHQKSKKKYKAFLITPENYTGKTNLGLKVGDDAEKLKMLYGNPANIVDTTLGQYWNYGNFLVIIERNLIKQWIYYETQILSF